MKKTLIFTAAASLIAGSLSAEEVKLGIIFGFTGPIESLTTPMAMGSELAIKEISDSGKFLNGSTVVGIRADSTCIDSAAAVAAAERLVTSDKVHGIVGGDCSGVTGAILQNVARPNGIVMVSPSATSPALSTVDDDGLFFRTSPSDARQGQVMTEVIMERGVKSVAVTFTNSDYGKGLAEAFETAFVSAGGNVTINAAHEDGKADYSAEVGALSAAGGDILVIAGYIDQGGNGILRAALDTGAFDTFHFPDGMISVNLENNFGSEVDGSQGQHPGTDSAGAASFASMAEAGGFDGTSPFAPESYDAAALIMLAMQASGSSKSEDYMTKIMDVANAPGEKIYPGDLAKALAILADGGDVDYVGGSAVELIGPGESAGAYRQIEIKGGKITTMQYR